MTSVSDPISEIEDSAERELGGVGDSSQLEAWRHAYLGRKGKLTLVLRGLADLPLEERRNLGAEANRIKLRLEAVYKDQLARLEQDRLVFEMYRLQVRSKGCDVAR